MQGTTRRKKRKVEGKNLRHRHSGFKCQSSPPAVAFFRSQPRFLEALQRSQQPGICAPPPEPRTPPILR